MAEAMCDSRGKRGGHNPDVLRDIVMRTCQLTLLDLENGKIGQSGCDYTPSIAGIQSNGVPKNNSILGNPLHLMSPLCTTMAHSSAQDVMTALQYHPTNPLSTFLQNENVGCRKRLVLRSKYIVCSLYYVTLPPNSFPRIGNSQTVYSLKARVPIFSEISLNTFCGQTYSWIKANDYHSDRCALLGTELLK